MCANEGGGLSLSLVRVMWHVCADEGGGLSLSLVRVMWHVFSVLVVFMSSML
jgi:hypothetical protein